MIATLIGVHNHNRNQMIEPCVLTDMTARETLMETKSKCVRQSALAPDTSSCAAGRERSRSTAAPPRPTGGGEEEAKKVKSYGVGDSFGELALMFNQRRAASVVATEECVLWAVDQMTFKAVMMAAAMSSKEDYK